MGPTRPPDGWNIRATALLDTPGAEPPPPGQAFVAASFPVIQEDEHGKAKVRRAEDWRRSGHGEGTRRADAPLRRRLRRHGPAPSGIGRRAGGGAHKGVRA